MRRLLRDLVAGQPLRHRPVALPPADQQPVRAFAESPGGEREVTAALFAVSLAPLLLGLARGTGGSVTGRTIVRMRDAASGVLLATLDAEPAGLFAHPGGALDLLRPIAASVHCVPALACGWRYARAWRHARRTARRPHAFAMKFKDLCALNVFYMMPRPVYLVSVVDGDAGNLFPMDLVGPLGEHGFLLALRLTSPSVELMRASGRIAVSAVPAEWKELAYRLGDHHRTRMLAWDTLQVRIAPSPVLGIPVPRDALGLRELAVERCEAVGSHMLFATSIVAHSAQRDAPQLCHVSDMYARWRVARGEPLTDA